MLAMLVVAAPAQAEADVVRLQSCVADARPGETLAAMTVRAPRFDCTTEQKRHGPGDFWVRLDPKAPSQRLVTGDADLRWASLWQDSMTVHVRHADGSTVTRHIPSTTLSRFIQIGAIVDIPVAGRAAAPTEIIVKVEGTPNLRGIIVAPRMATRSAAHSEQLWMATIYAGFAGLVMALLVYNFVLWDTLRHRFQLYYCAMIAATAAYAFTSSGALALLMPFLDNNDRLRINYVLLALTASAAIQFLGSFFERDVVTPRVKQLIHLSTVAMIGTALAFAVFAPRGIWWLDRTYFASFVLMLSLVFPLLWLAWRQRSRYLRWFLVAWSVPIAVTSARALYGFGLLPYSFWLDNGTILAMGFESLLNSLVIGLRVRILIEERDREKAQKAVAQALAETDPLTGLLNRRAFLSAAIGRPLDQRLILLDIDHFKRVNDTIGHDGGDDVLRAVALALGKWSPTGALVARLGGEEFAVLLPAGQHFAPTTLLDAVRRQPMPRGLAVTASAGVADGSLRDEDDWRDLYRRADGALYRAKADGRDRVCVATLLPRAA